MTMQLLFILVAILVGSVSAIQTADHSAPDTSDCEVVPDFIPDRVKQCSSGIKISCTGRTICYSYLESLKTIPCLLTSYSMPSFLKFSACGREINFKVLPGARTCIEEEELRKFYKCFNDGQ